MTKENFAKYGSHSLNGIFFLTLILIGLNNFKETETKEYKADCVIRETAVAIKKFGTLNDEARHKTIDYVEFLCGVKPYHTIPTGEEIAEAIAKSQE